jgi:small subunit ribosomal protein S6
MELYHSTGLGCEFVADVEGRCYNCGYSSCRSQKKNRFSAILEVVFLRKYETMLVARQDLDQEALEALIEAVSAVIKREGGSVAGVDIWGSRRLEYPIDHEETGQYAVIRFEAKEGIAGELDRLSAIRDEILRMKTFVKE